MDGVLFLFFSNWSIQYKSVRNICYCFRLFFFLFFLGFFFFLVFLCIIDER